VAAAFAARDRNTFCTNKFRPAFSIFHLRASLPQHTHTRKHTHWQTSDRHTRGHQNGIGSRRVWPKIVTVFLLQQLKKSQKESQLQSTSLLLLPLPLPLQSPTSVSVGQLPLASFSVHFPIESATTSGSR